MAYIAIPIIDPSLENRNIDSNTYMLLKYYYTKLKEDKILDVSFYDGGASTFTEFRELATQRSIVFLFVFHKEPGGLPIAHCHLSGMQGYCMSAHFSILRKYHKNFMEIMQDTLLEIFACRREDDTPFVTSLIGLTPKYNRAARNAIAKIGFRHLTFIDKACYVYSKDKYYDGHLTILEADTFLERVE